MKKTLSHSILKCCKSIIKVCVLPLFAITINACSSGSSNDGFYSKTPNASSSSVGYSSGSSSSSSGGEVDLLSLGQTHYEAMCQGCHGVDGRGGSATGLTVDDLSFVELRNYIENSMPRNNAGNCVGTCADAAATYVQSLFTSEPTPSTPLVVKNTSLGHVFSVDGNALIGESDESNNISGVEVLLDTPSLYTFSNDTVGESNCVTAACVNNWPPLFAYEGEEAAYPYTIITRADGNLQWALQGKPLYTYIQDTSPEDVLGHGVGGVWFIATVAPVQKQENETLGDFLIANRTVTVLLSDGEPLSDKTGFSLYIFANDSETESNCTGACLDNWPALLLGEDLTVSEPYSLITRNDTELKQLAHDGKPLYFFHNDTQAGDTFGTEITNWSLARPIE